MRNFRKTTEKFFSILILLNIINFQGCQDDDRLPFPVTVQFNATPLELSEGQKVTIHLQFDRAAPADGSITILVESNYIQDFLFEPDFSDGLLTIDVTKGQTNVAFEVTATDNGLFEGKKIIDFKIIELSGALKLGTLITFKLTIIDDEGPSMANFEVPIGVLYENDAAGIVVNIPLSIPTHGEGNITVQLDSGMTGYGTYFTTNPALIEGKITFNVSNATLGVSFTVLPVDNNNLQGDFKLPFSIFSVSGVIARGKKLNYSLRIIDDERPSVVNFVSAFGVLPENSVNAMVVKISFSKLAKVDGSITISVIPGLAIYGTHFTTIPGTTNNTIVLPVTQGQSEAALTILPVDNEIFSDDVILQFSISEVAGVMQKGSNLNYTLVIKDNETLSIVNFKTTRWVYPDYYGNGDTYPLSESEINENNVIGVVVPILLSEPAKAPGSITITWHDGSIRCGVKADYGTTFTSSPDGAQGSIVIPVAKGDAGASFKVFPVNDNLFTDVSSITFEISEVSGILKKGTLLDHTLRIDDNEVGSLANFTNSGGTINEDDANGVLVEVLFSEATHGASSITIDLRDGYGTKYTTDPSSTSGTSLTWNLVPGSTGISFKVLPIDNSICGNFYLSFSASTCGFLMGQPYYQKTIEDNDYSIVNFVESSGNISENNASGKIVTLNFSKPVLGTAEIYLYTSDGGWDFNKKYTTIPPMYFDYSNGGYIYLAVQQNASDAQFTVNPINNSVKYGDYNLGFTMGAGGCLRVGPKDKYSLKIVDDD